ncbi:MAG: icmS [Francisellaceae bacterium]|nr:icmS [Francisellaceae bacterium]
MNFLVNDERRPMSISSQLSAVATTLGCQFQAKGQPLMMEQVFSPTGLLPAILRRADQLCSFCLGHGLGATFERSDNALKGVVVTLDDVVPTSIRLLCCLDVIMEFMHNAPSPDKISLDDLMAD